MSNIAIVGATGMVGRTFLKILDQEQITITNLYLFASSRSAGSKIGFQNNEYTVIELTEENIKKQPIDYALFSAGASVSLQYAPIFKKYGVTVIDNSSAWRQDDSISLLVPEVNMDSYNNDLIIANPNCSTIQSVLPLKALKHYGLKHINYTTYQAVSGSGMNGVEDLKRTSKGLPPSNYPHPIYNNVLPHIDTFLENGYTKEEIKMINETRKILSEPTLEVNATCIRVPVENSHGVVIDILLDSEFDVETVRKELDDFNGIKVLDDPQNNIYPTNTYATGKNEVFVGRIRRDVFNKQVLHLYCVSDNIRKGAALNAVQIMKELIRRKKNV